MNLKTKDSPKTARNSSAAEAFRRRRFLARTCAIKYAFQMDVQDDWEASDQQLADFRLHLRFELLGGDEDEQIKPAADKELTAAWEHALRLMRGLAERREEVDSLIRQAATNWTLARMSLVDKAICGRRRLKWPSWKKSRSSRRSMMPSNWRSDMGKLIRRVLSTVFWIASGRI